MCTRSKTANDILIVLISLTGIFCYHMLFVMGVYINNVIKYGDEYDMNTGCLKSMPFCTKKDRLNCYNNIGNCIINTVPYTVAITGICGFSVVILVLIARLIYVIYIECKDVKKSEELIPIHTFNFELN